MARAAERRVPTPRVLLTWGPEDGHHVLQEAMWHHRAELAAHGVHYPGGFPEAHFQAAVDLQGVDFNDWHDEEAEGAWARMAEQVRGLSGTVVLSHELFGKCSAERARRALQDLAFADVELILTLRDSGPIPVAWQEDLKNRHYMSFEEFAATVSRTTTSAPGTARVLAAAGRTEAARPLGGKPADGQGATDHAAAPRLRPGGALASRRLCRGRRSDVVDTAHPAIRRNRSLGPGTRSSVRWTSCWSTRSAVGRRATPTRAARPSCWRSRSSCSPRPCSSSPSPRSAARAPARHPVRRAGAPARVLGGRARTRRAVPAVARQDPRRGR